MYVYNKFAKITTIAIIQKSRSVSDFQFLFIHARPKLCIYSDVQKFICT